MNKENKEGRNLEEINKKRILKFSGISLDQQKRGIDVDWRKAWVMCERCDEQVEAKLSNRRWDVGDWKVYLRKSQVKKNDNGYYIIGGIKFYCPECDRKHNYLERN